MMNIRVVHEVGGMTRLAIEGDDLVELKRVLMELVLDHHPVDATALNRRDGGSWVYHGTFRGCDVARVCDKIASTPRRVER